MTLKQVFCGVWTGHGKDRLIVDGHLRIACLRCGWQSPGLENWKLDRYRARLAADRQAPGRILHFRREL
jgi:hypothetical protein